MPPRLVPCHCDPAWPAMAVCPTCEARQRRALLERRMTMSGGVAAAFDALIASYDAADRARDAADAHRLEATA